MDKLIELNQDLHESRANLAKRMQEDPDCQPFDVYEENVPALEFFLRCKTQWRTSFGGLIGLDYSAVKVLADAWGVKLDQDMMERVTWAEEGALEQIHDKGSKPKKPKEEVKHGHSSKHPPKVGRPRASRRGR